jgi:hypothetical protein
MMHQFTRRDMGGLIWNQVEPKLKPEDADVTLVVKQDLIGVTFYFAAADNVDTMTFTRRGEVQSIRAIRFGAAELSKIPCPWDLATGDIVELRYGIAEPITVTAIGVTCADSGSATTQANIISNFKAYAALLASENQKPPQLKKQKWQPPRQVDMTKPYFVDEWTVPGETPA